MNAVTNDVVFSPVDQLCNVVMMAEKGHGYAIDLVVWGEEAAAHYHDVRTGDGGAVIGDLYCRGSRVGTRMLNGGMVVEFERVYHAGGQRVVNIHKADKETEDGFFDFYCP